MDKCNICPRKCNADRRSGEGFCHSPVLLAARAGLHFGEEPPISGTKGSGTIFFSGCNLKCVFCQNVEISDSGIGKPITTDRLAEIFLELQDKQAHNINLVTPTHFANEIITALKAVRDRLHIPVVYNCGGYESVETLKRLYGLVDIYLPDFKYADERLATEYSKAPNYPGIAAAALKEMHRQTGRVSIDDNGIMQSGVIVRHLVLPNCRHDSMRVLDIIADTVPVRDIRISLMRQYVPCHKALAIKALSRRVTTFEYDSVVNYAAEKGFTGYTQQKGSATSDMIPEWNYEGL